MSTHDTDVDKTLDAKGEVCPMPLAKTKDTVDTLTTGEILEVVATEQNSIPDFERWAGMTDDVELIDQVETEAAGQALYKHYLRKTG